MAFDVQAFETKNFTDRTEPVPVPKLAVFFDKGDEPVWIVRGLTGLESAQAKQAVQNNKNMDAILSAIGTNIKREKIEGIKELAGLAGDAVPDELVQRYAWLKYGSVDPACSHETAMKLAENFPEDFYLLTNKIMQLTGQGRLGE